MQLMQIWSKLIFSLLSTYLVYISYVFNVHNLSASHTAQKWLQKTFAEEINYAMQKENEE